MEHEGVVPEYHLQPGEMHLVTGPALLRTVLGSCVGVAFWAERLGVSALCHPMLPRVPEGVTMPEKGRRYVDYAIRELAGKFDRLGLQRREISVKVFGGADVLQMPGMMRRPTVGRLNGEAALEVLYEEGFDVAAVSLGGDAGVDLRFDTATGSVFVRRLPMGLKSAENEGVKRQCAQSGTMQTGKVNRWSAC